jgi:hypothetical protein
LCYFEIEEFAPQPEAVALLLNTSEFFASKLTHLAFNFDPRLDDEEITELFRAIMQQCTALRSL